MSIDTPDERLFELKPDHKGFSYVLKWMDYLLEKEIDADPSYILEWRTFIEACQTALVVSETHAPLVQVAWAQLGTARGELYVRATRQVDEGQNDYYHHALFVRDPNAAPQALQPADHGRGVGDHPATTPAVAAPFAPSAALPTTATWEPCGKDDPRFNQGAYVPYDAKYVATVRSNGDTYDHFVVPAPEFK